MQLLWFELSSAVLTPLNAAIHVNWPSVNVFLTWRCGAVVGHRSGAINETFDPEP